MDTAKVLVVEDTAEIRDVIELALADARLVVRTAGDGHHALAELRSWRPDVVVLDLNIPGLGGLEVCRQLRQFSTAYVLMLTALADEVDKLVGPLRIDVEAREVRVGDERLTLTKIEFDLLTAVTENVRQVRTREQLRERVWGGAWLADNHAVDVHMSKLRRKLATVGAADVIETVRGVGYRVHRS